MNEEFINVYIETLNKKNEELNRNEILLNTRLAIAERLIKALSSEKTDLEQQLEKAQASLNKKAAKNKDDF